MWPPSIIFLVALLIGSVLGSGCNTQKRSCPDNSCCGADFKYPTPAICNASCTNDCIGKCSDDCRDDLNDCYRGCLQHCGKNYTCLFACQEIKCLPRYKNCSALCNSRSFGDCFSGKCCDCFHSCVPLPRPSPVPTPSRIRTPTAVVPTPEFPLPIPEPPSPTPTPEFPLPIPEAPSPTSTPEFPSPAIVPTPSPSVCDIPCGSDLFEDSEECEERCEGRCFFVEPLCPGGCNSVCAGINGNLCQCFTNGTLPTSTPIPSPEFPSPVPEAPSPVPTPQASVCNATFEDFEECILECGETCQELCSNGTGICFMQYSVCNNGCANSSNITQCLADCETARTDCIASCPDVIVGICIGDTNCCSCRNNTIPTLKTELPCHKVCESRYPVCQATCLEDADCLQLCQIELTTCSEDCSGPLSLLDRFLSLFGR